MICRQNFNSLVFIKPSPEPGDGCRCLKQSLGGESAESTYEVGLDGRNLTLQKRETGFDLIGFGIPVARRTALDDIANINLAAGKFDGFDDTGKQLTGCTDKGFSLPILFKARTLADKYQLGPFISVTKYNIVSSLGKSAALAITQIGANIVQCFGIILCVLPPFFKLGQRVAGAVKTTTSIVG